MTASRARQKLREITRRRESLYQSLSSFRLAMVAGSLVERKVCCGKKTCRCRAGELHGPFTYLVDREGDRTRWLYLGKASMGPVAEAARRRARFQSVLEELRDLREEEMACARVIEEALLVPAASLKKSSKKPAASLKKSSKKQEEAR